MEDGRPLQVGLAIGVRATGDSEAGTGASDDAEDYEKDPSELFAKAMAEDNEGGEKEDWDVDAKLYGGDDFLTGAHLDG